MNTPTWSRREFLELSSAAAWASLATQPLRARRVPPSDTVRFGMIGVGMQGSGLLGAAIALPGVTCAAAADLYDGRHTLAKEIAGPTLPATREYRRLLDDKTIDCVIAAVPDHWHRRMVVEAVSAIGGDEAAEFLEYVATGHSDADLRNRAREGLERLGRHPGQPPEPK